MHEQQWGPNKPYNSMRQLNRGASASQDSFTAKPLHAATIVHEKSPYFVGGVRVVGGVGVDSFASSLVFPFTTCWNLTPRGLAATAPVTSSSVGWLDVDVVDERMNGSFVEMNTLSGERKRRGKQFMWSTGWLAVSVTLLAPRL